MKTYVPQRETREVLGFELQLEPEAEGVTCRVLRAGTRSGVRAAR